MPDAILGKQGALTADERVQRQPYVQGGRAVVERPEQDFDLLARFSEP